VSQRTYEAVEAAIREHMADENDGAYLTAWTLAAAGADPADPETTHYVYANHNGAPHEWMGLQAMAARRAARWDAGEGT